MRHFKHRAGYTWPTLLLLLGAVVLLVAVLLPVFSRTREGHRPRCKSHAKQMSTALQMYLQDYDHRFPPASYVSGTQSYTLPYLLYPYIKNAYVFGCPEGHPEGTKAQYDQSQADTSVDYGYNAAALTQDGRGIAEDRVLEPAATVVLAESSSYRTAPTALTPALGGTPPVYRHQETNNVAFADGHVKALRREVLEMNSESESGHRLGSGIDRFPYWNLR